VTGAEKTGAEIRDHLAGFEHRNGNVPSAWPAPLADAAFHGPAGDFLRAVAPHSEADLAALLVQYLVVAGNLFGTGSYYQVEGDRHPPRLYAVICGPTSVGRKGTALGRVRQVAEGVDPEWSARIGGGLSSGEGPLWHVRDPIINERRKPRKGEPIDGNGFVVEDPGVPDKRLLVVEAELSQHFDVMVRSGNTLSPTVRRLWDGGVVQSMTKNSPHRATDPHVSIIGHIPRDEVRRKLTMAESASGFANRFLWVAARRRQSLPFGGNLEPEALLELRAELAGAVHEVRARGEQRLTFSTDATEGTLDAGEVLDGAAGLWRAVYDDLNVLAERPGMVGAILARAAPQVIRLAVTYACLDAARLIERHHLQAALAVWAYCHESAGWIFGDATGDPLADQLHAALRGAGDGGLTRTDIREVVHHRHAVERIDTALSVLLFRGLARFVDEPTGGRTAQRWFTATKVAAP
jgi:hypothetical protein